MKYQDKLEMLEEIKRSELITMAQSLGIDANEYIQQVVREYPELAIINDMGYRNTIV